MVARLLLLGLVCSRALPALADRAEQVGYFDEYLKRNQFAREVSWEELRTLLGPALEPYEAERAWFTGRVWAGFATMPKKHMLPPGERGPVFFTAQNLATHFDKHQHEVNAVTVSGRKKEKLIYSDRGYVNCARALTGSTSPNVLTIVATHAVWNTPVLYRYDLAKHNLLILGGEYFTRGITLFESTPERMLASLRRNTRRDPLTPRAP